MEFDITSTFNHLSQFPVDLIYFLVVSLPLILTLGYALIVRKRVEHREVVHHVMTGCEIVLILETIILLSSLFSPKNLTKTSIVFIISECLAGTLIITWVAWTFLDEDDKFLFNGVSLFLTNGLILAAVGSVLWTIFLPDANLFQALGLFKLWHTLSLILILVGLIRIITSRPKQRVIAALILVVLAVGFIIQIILQDANSYQMGAVRFSQMISMPWILFLVRRFEGKTESELLHNGSEKSGQVPNLVDTKPALVNALLKISFQETAVTKYKAVVRAISLSVVSDICLLTKFSNDNGEIQILAGYDLIRERFLPEKTLNQEELPQIIGHWKTNKYLNLSGNDSESRDGLTLSELLSYYTVGNLLAYPISLNDGSSEGGVILLSPYTNKSWDNNILELLNAIKTTLGKVVFSQTKHERINAELNISRTDINRLQQEKNALTQVLVEKHTEINAKESALKQLKARFQIDKLASVKQIEQLQKEINELIKQKTENDRNDLKNEELQREIVRLTEEKDHLQKELSNAVASILAFEAKIEQTGPIRLSLEKRIVSLDAIAANSKQYTARNMAQRHQNLEIINPDGRQMVRTDPDLLHKALVGLLENAIEASQRGSKIQMHMKLSFETGILVMKIIDFGEGLSPSEQQALFRADHENIPGVGNIHAIRDAIRAIRLLQGKIWLKSKKNDFTTFRVQVPVRIID